jgi:N utilization substance protein B
MGARRKSREFALQVLFSVDASGEPADRALNLFWCNNSGIEQDTVSFTDELVRGVVSKLSEIDPIISANSSNWKISRMAIVDRNILRLAIFELFFLRDIPKRVTINEAIEIAKEFGTEESGSFVNGILDKIAKGIKDKE